MSDRPIAAELAAALTSAQLPALPQSAVRILEIAKNPDNGPSEYAVPIESDPGLTGQVLKFVNSSYFGFTREIANVKLAITLVGVRTIKNFTLWSAVFSLMPNPKCGPFDLKSLWQDSLRRGLFARRMGRLLGLKDGEDAFAAALLQDMAVPLLAREFPEAYREMLGQRDGGRARLSTLEQERLGWTHADAAAFMCEHWNLPNDLADVMQQHTAIDELLAKTPRPSAEVAVALSALLPVTVDENWSECWRFESCYEKASPDGAPSILEIFSEVDQEFIEFAPVLRMPTPTKTLVEWYQSATAVKAS